MTGSSADKNLRIRVELDFSQVHWRLAASILMSHFNLTSQAADKLISSFRRRFQGPLNLYWFRRSKPDQDDERILAALFEAHGADILSLSAVQQFSLWHLSCAYEQQVTFQPVSGIRQAEGVSVVPEVRVRLGRFQLKLKQLRSVLAVHLLLVLCGALFYVVAAACFLYGVAVLLLFIVEPAYVTLAATRRLPLGLALICMLAGLAGICGRAFRNVLGLIWQSFYRSSRK